MAQCGIARVGILTAKDYKKLIFKLYRSSCSGVVIENAFEIQNEEANFKLLELALIEN